MFDLTKYIVRLVQTYEENAMAEGKWVRMLNEGNKNVRYKERSGRPPLAPKKHRSKTSDKKVRSKRRLTIFDWSINFQNSSQSLLREIVTENVCTTKNCIFPLKGQQTLKTRFVTSRRILQNEYVAINTHALIHLVNK